MTTDLIKASDELARLLKEESDCYSKFDDGRIEMDAALSAYRAAREGAGKVKPLEWDKHPDGDGYYAFPNDDGDCLYVADRLDSGRWRLFIGSCLVEDECGQVMKWDKCQGAMRYAEEDLKSRLSRIRSALAVG